jgi:hypothetical protein
MINNFSEIQVNIDSKICRFYVQQDMPLGNVKEALFQLQRYIGQIEENAKAQLESQENKIEELPKENHVN